jgi:hypothetical protein
MLSRARQVVVELPREQMEKDNDRSGRVAAESHALCRSLLRTTVCVWIQGNLDCSSDTGIVIFFS